MPGCTYVKNLVGLRLSDQQLEDIPCPRSELFLHPIVKSVQAFTTLGAVVVGPSVSLYRGERDCESIRKSAATYATYGALAGLVVGPLISLASTRKMEKSGCFDRCLRLRCSKNQMRVDRLAAVGALGGAGAAIYLGEKGLDGAVLGLSGGVILAAVLNRFL
eukprot:GHVU01159530.1.p1 GENE.GHVU01159530.1~~GHVU01159530.1.p1  ORF type:complete len:162 (+),score=6.24 GHVU01159530.1:96-581(+)